MTAKIIRQQFIMKSKNYSSHKLENKMCKYSFAWLKFESALYVFRKTREYRETVSYNYKKIIDYVKEVIHTTERITLLKLNAGERGKQAYFRCRLRLCILK